MYTKSIIQQRIEAFQIKNDFRLALENLMNKYTIDDSVFVYNNGLKEIVEGYFIENGEYTDLATAISECDVNTMGIRVVENKFYIGSIHNKISECEDNKPIFDIKRLENIR